MRKLILTLTLTLFGSTAFCQTETLNSEHLLELGKHYSSFMFRNDPPKQTSKSLGKEYNENLSGALNFVKEVTASDNKILSQKFLTLPDSNTLRVIYIIDAIHQNAHVTNSKKPKTIVDSLKNAEIPYHFLVDQFYSSIFTSVGNKNKPFNLSKVNFDLKSYGLKSALHRSIFYLRCMEMCSAQIFGFMNIVNPPNTEKALSYIEKFPKFNNLSYFQFADLGFEDFQMQIFNDKGIITYKAVADVLGQKYVSPNELF